MYHTRPGRFCNREDEAVVPTETCCSEEAADLLRYWIEVYVVETRSGWQAGHCAHLQKQPWKRSISRHFKWIVLQTYQRKETLHSSCIHSATVLKKKNKTHQYVSGLKNKSVHVRCMVNFTKTMHQTGLHNTAA